MNPRFTIDGSDALEQHLAQVCEQVRDGVRRLVPRGRLDGLLLGGGYGRGEGGVLATSAGDQPYNDLEFFVFVRGQALLAERMFRQPLHQLGERLTPSAGVEVEFKVLTLDKFRRRGPTMFYYDLMMGHRWLKGDDSLFTGCDRHRDASLLPQHETLRLLMNRCSGLLYSKERLQRLHFGADDADFVGRNLAKAQLAFGDVILAAHGQYHWSCRERSRRLSVLTSDAAPALARLREHHALGVAFKLRPVRSQESQQALAARHAELTELGATLWCWLEARRLGRHFANTRDYAVSPDDKCPETARWRNRLVNLRTFRSNGIAGERSHRYPRQRLLHALCLLLWESDPIADEASAHQLSEELNTDATDFPGFVAAYHRLWSRFN